ncbi:MAG TPA: zeta toxin family protein [Anaerolineaceae bacterium]|nr:zeta toxin family protein [Anaerolineaceae bacterium]
MEEVKDMPNPLLQNNDLFSEKLFEKMVTLCPALNGLELFEFRYCLENITPKPGWQSVELKSKDEIEQMVNSAAFYSGIQLKPKLDNRPTMDPQILSLLRMLFVGLTTGDYPTDWVEKHFTFDPRGFYFIHRSEYYTENIIAHLGGKPFLAFERLQNDLQNLPAVGYKDFKKANEEVDEAFIRIVHSLVEKMGTPILIAIAGQTAAGKTEIVERLQQAFQSTGKSISGLEIDHFLTDRDYREAHGIDSLGQEALHFEMLTRALEDLRAGRAAMTPQYDFISATSSHALDGKLKPGRDTMRIEPADIIFMEGNFPFLLPEIAALTGIKVMYITDDAVRLKRKWRRDMDFRKKYELYYFLNRYFREQFLMAEQVYKPQMELCELVVDTSRVEIWATPGIQPLLTVTSNEN